MLKKHLLNFAIFASILLVVDLLLYYINHDRVDAEEIVHVIKILLLTGVTLVPLSLFLEKRKKSKNPKKQKR